MVYAAIDLHRKRSHVVALEWARRPGGVDPLPWTPLKEIISQLHESTQAGNAKQAGRSRSLFLPVVSARYDRNYAE